MASEKSDSKLSEQFHEFYQLKLVILQNKVKDMYTEQGLVFMKSAVKTKADCIMFITKAVPLMRRVNKPKIEDLTPLDSKYHELKLKNPIFKDHGKLFRITDKVKVNKLSYGRISDKSNYIRSIYNHVFTDWKMKPTEYFNIDTNRCIKATAVDNHTYRNDFFNLVSSDKSYLSMYIEVLTEYFKLMKNIVTDHLGCPGYVMLECKPIGVPPIKMRVTRGTPYVDEKYGIATDNKRLLDLTLGYITGTWNADYNVVSTAVPKDGKDGMSSNEVLMNTILDARGFKQLSNPGYFRLDSIPNKRFDFAFVHEGQKIIIEVDGEQHFKAVEHWGGDEALEKNKSGDILKTQAAIKEGFRIFRFSKLTSLAMNSNLDIALKSSDKFWCDSPKKYAYIIKAL